MFEEQVFSNPQPLMLSGGGADGDGGISRVCRRIPFLMLGSGVGYAGWRIAPKSCRRRKTAPRCRCAERRRKDNLEALLKVEPLAVEVGLGLVKLVEGGQNSPLLRRIAGIRRQMATDLGYMVPPVRVTDNLQLKAMRICGAAEGRGDRPL